MQKKASSKTIQDLEQKLEFYELVLDNIRNGVMITDPEGKIIFSAGPIK